MGGCHCVMVWTASTGAKVPVPAAWQIPHRLFPFASKSAVTLGWVFSRQLPTVGELALVSHSARDKTEPKGSPLHWLSVVHGPRPPSGRSGGPRLVGGFMTPVVALGSMPPSGSGAPAK